MKAVCPFCGCLCDDIVVDVADNKINKIQNACALGKQRFLEIYNEDRITQPQIKNNGTFEKTDYETAIEKASSILKNAERCLIFGLSNTSCETYIKTLELAEVICGVIDNTSSLCHGPMTLGMQEIGISSCTLGDVKNRADLIIYWGSNPVESHPRHLKRYSYQSEGLFVKKGDRKLVGIDIRKTSIAKFCDMFVQIEPNGDFELIQALKCAISNKQIPDNVAGVSKEDIQKLAKMMLDCKFGVVFAGLGLTMTDGKHINTETVIRLVQLLNNHTKFFVIPMRGHYNVTGADQTCAWECGYPYAVDFMRGTPRYNPGETAACDLLTNEEVDAALIIASDPISHFPKKASDYLKKIPYVAIDPFSTPTTNHADIVLPSKVVGIETEGSAYRMDEVPLNMKKIVDAPSSDLLSDEEIVGMILNSVKAE